MPPTLLVTDPLAGQAVTIAITLLAADGPRDTRPSLGYYAPLRASESYDDWFATQLEAQAGDLSPA